MKREIKFRAWDKDMREMVFVSGIQFDPHSPKEKPNIIDIRNDIRDLEEVELMQFTGLKDKNGVELYAHDIFQDKKGVKYHCYNVVGGFAHSLPQFPSTFNSENAWPLQPLADEQTVSWFESNCEVIGNIYSNPDLLKEL